MTKIMFATVCIRTEVQLKGMKNLDEQAVEQLERTLGLPKDRIAHEQPAVVVDTIEEIDDGSKWVEGPFGLHEVDEPDIDIDDENL